MYKDHVESFISVASLRGVCIKSRNMIWQIDDDTVHFGGEVGNRIAYQLPLLLL